jgi:hypothetical protein
VQVEPGMFLEPAAEVFVPMSGATIQDQVNVKVGLPEAVTAAWTSVNVNYFGPFFTPFGGARLPPRGLTHTTGAVVSWGIGHSNPRRLQRSGHSGRDNRRAPRVRDASATAQRPN